MKKIRVLQILIYIVFGLFILQNVGDDMYRGFKAGFNDYGKDVKAATGPSKQVQISITEGKIITGNGTDTFNIGPKYNHQNVTIQTTVDGKTFLPKPWWLTTTNIALLIITLYLLYKMATNINTVILNIYKGTMFDEQSIKLIQKTGLLVILFSVVDYAYQWYDYKEQLLTISESLKIDNTVAFSFGMLLCAIFVFIIAEAFKQGGKLKEEQELTI